MSDLEKYLKNIIYILIVGAFVSCLFIFKSWIFPYITSKAIPFRIMIELMSLAYLILALKYPKYRPQKSWILYSLLIFTGIAIVTSALGINPRLSFVGDLERMWGINMWVHLLLFFVVISSVLKSKKEWFIFLNFSLIIASYIAIYGYLQRWGVEGIFQTGITRIQSVLGNSAYVAGILLLSSMLTVYLLIKTKGFWWKSLFGIHLLIQLPAMFMAEIRGAQVAFFFVLLIILLAFIFRSKNKLVKNSLVIFLLLLIIIFGLAFRNKEAGWVKENSILRRLTTISLSGGTVRTRLISWSAGLQAVQERPISGFGMENYYYAFDKYFQADYYNIAASETWFDRAHNMVMENLVAHGIFGLLAYLSIFIITLIYLYKIYKKNPEENWLFSLFFGSLVVAYFIQNFFVFDSLAVTMFFFFILAYINYKTTNELEKDIIYDNQLPKIVNGAIISLGAIIGFYFLFGMNSSHVQIAKQNYEVQKSFYQDKSFSAIRDKIETLFNINSYLNRDSVTMSIDTLIQVLSRVKTQKEAQDLYDINTFLIQETKKYLEYNKKDAYLQLNLARLYMAKASMVNPESNEFKSNLELAKDVIDYSIELTPERLHNYFLRSRINLNLGKIEEATQDLKNAIKYNEEYGTSYWLLSQIYSELGEDVLTLETMNKAIKYRHGFLIGDVKKALKIYDQKDGYIDQKIYLYKRLTKFESKGSTYTILGKLYKEKGDLKMAEEYLNKASELYNKK
jgi:O-antigen ligase